MKRYTDCRTYHTGLYKPHTIQLENGFTVSIVYYDKTGHTNNMKHFAIATDSNGNNYDIFSEKKPHYTGYLAFPQDPDKINGFYPWL